MTEAMKQMLKMIHGSDTGEMTLYRKEWQTFRALLALKLIDYEFAHPVYERADGVTVTDAGRAYLAAKPE